MDIDTQLDECRRLLHRWGMYPVGCSQKSRSTYWATGPDSEALVRVSDHDIAYSCSTAPILVGVEGMMEAHVILGRDGWQERLRAALAAEIERHELEGYEDTAEADGVDPAEERADRLAWCRKRFPLVFAGLEVAP